MSPSAISNYASLQKDTLNLIDEAQDIAWRYYFVPAAGMSPNAILNSTLCQREP